MRVDTLMFEPTYTHCNIFDLPAWRGMRAGDLSYRTQLDTLVVKVRLRPTSLDKTGGYCLSCSTKQTCDSGFVLTFYQIFAIFVDIQLWRAKRVMIVTPAGEEACNAAKAENERKIKTRFMFKGYYSAFDARDMGYWVPREHSGSWKSGG